MEKWRCTVCGSISEDQNPPARCTMCGAGREEFSRLKQEKSAGTNSLKHWKCPVCGYIHGGEYPPRECPLCGAGAAMFLLINEESIADAGTAANADSACEVLEKINIITSAKDNKSSGG